MSNFFYQPMEPQPSGYKTPEGEDIFLGPYNKEQAPFVECANCGQPITVGQRLVPSMTEAILGITRSGYLIYVFPVNQDAVAPVHSDCSAEYAHDQITKEPCARDEDDSDCQFCGTEIPDGYRACAKCASELGIPQ